MKNITLALIALIIFVEGVNIYMIYNLKKQSNLAFEYCDVLKDYIDAQIYKKDSQLYLMNTAYNDENVHKALADSCKNDCIKYKNRIKR